MIQGSWIKHNTLVSAKFIIENFGQTPAKNCNIRGGIRILPFPLPKRYVFPISETPSEQKASVYPKAIIPTIVETSQVFTKAEIAEITAQNTHRRAYIFGILNYKDIFDDDHFTNFCCFLILDSTPKKDETGQPIKTFTWADCDQHTDFN
jgi:hypothetical protein